MVIDLYTSYRSNIRTRMVAYRYLTAKEFKSVFLFISLQVDKFHINNSRLYEDGVVSAAVVFFFLFFSLATAFLSSSMPSPSVK